MTDMIRPFLDAGGQHLIVELADGAGPESITLAAKALAPLASQPSLHERPSGCLSGR
jgi:hypothetical protein